MRVAGHVRSSVLSFILIAIAGCGGGSSTGFKSAPLVAEGVGSSMTLSGGKLWINMPIDASMGLADFVMKAKQKLGDKPPQSSFRADSADLTLDLSTSKALQYYQDAFSGDIDVSLKPGSGTDPGVPLGTIKAPQGNGKLNVSLNVNQKMFDGLQDDILDASLVLEAAGRTNWNGGETRQIGIIGELVIEVVTK